MIRSFKDAATAQVWQTGKAPKGFPSNLVRRALRSLSYVYAAVVLDDLKMPPGNRLHALTDDRTGQHAIWINDQFRVCFVWQDGDAHAVEITDYH